MGAALALALGWYAVAHRGGNEGPSAAPFTGGDLHSLVVDPADPSRLFVGGHQAVAVSVDGAKSWQQVDSLEDADAMGWAFTADAVLVGGHPGLSVSTDGGRTFERRNGGLPATDIHALGAGGGVVYAASPQVGVFASTDGARTWEVRTRGAGQAFMGRILVDPSNRDHLVAPDMRSGVVESADGGRSWRSLGGVAGALWVSWDPGNPAHLIATGDGESVASVDGGRSWTSLPAPAGASLLELGPAGPDVVYAATHEAGSGRVKLEVSRDGG
ncbi:MAG: WD40/YVTN/BNR-like repeat-containing protein, partial [Actinomycetota bacterium]